MSPRARSSEKTARLDLLYIPTRYPSGLPGGLPSNAFRVDDAERALSRAGGIIDAVARAFDA